MTDPQYPDGKLREDDGGATQVGIGDVDGRVIVQFTKPVTWIGFPPKEAREFANTIIRHADAIEAKGSAHGHH